MKWETILAAAAVIALGYAVARVVVVTSQDPAPAASLADGGREAPGGGVRPRPRADSPDGAESPPGDGDRPRRGRAARGGRPNPAGRGAGEASDPVAQVVARAALARVGLDPAAEDLWVEAINDPTFPPEVRKNLIEDLNEEGFSDPKNLTADDLPLIVYRIRLIEQIAGDALDEVNAAAFEEAHKDLVSMYVKVARE